ncbi:DUF4279 domain-containing protein [Metabacillus sp. JX24]|uniref:DUF4279 domain-containing protein n=1 Tax=Metabacillus sp. JX24 TaxID=3240759 RepID=UPI00350F1F1E
MKKTSIRIEFYIIGDYFPLEDVTNTLGIFPTESYNKGEKIRENLFRKETVWSINTPDTHSLDVNKQVTNTNLSILSSPFYYIKYISPKSMQI